jgi:hypothetical protein
LLSQNSLAASTILLHAAGLGFIQRFMKFGDGQGMAGHVDGQGISIGISMGNCEISLPGDVSDGFGSGMPQLAIHCLPLLGASTGLGAIEVHDTLRFMETMRASGLNPHADAYKNAQAFASRECHQKPNDQVVP